MVGLRDNSNLALQTGQEEGMVHQRDGDTNVPVVGILYRMALGTP